MLVLVYYWCIIMGEYIVYVTSIQYIGKVSSLITSIGGRILGYVTGEPIIIASIPDNVISRVMLDPHVRQVEKNFRGFRVHQL